MHTYIWGREKKSQASQPGHLLLLVRIPLISLLKFVSSGYFSFSRNSFILFLNNSRWMLDRGESHNSRSSMRYLEVWLRTYIIYMWMIQLIYCWDFDDVDKKIIIQLIETWVNDKRREKERKGSELVNKKVIVLPIMDY